MGGAGQVYGRYPFQLICAAVSAVLVLATPFANLNAQLSPPTTPVAPAAATPTSTTISVPTVRTMLPRDRVVLQVLDKVSARVTTLRVNVGQSAAFGLLTLKVRSCQASLPSDAPESAAFLEISEIDARNLPATNERNKALAETAYQQRLVFTGWMFASSPALSAMEHPTYDVIVLACESDAPAAPTPTVDTDSASKPAPAAAQPAADESLPD